MNYEERRENLWKHISKDKDHVVICTNEESTYSEDLKHAFRPNSNMIYLTGCTRPNVIALLHRRGNVEIIVTNFASRMKSLSSVAISYEASTFRPEHSAAHRAVRPYLDDWEDCSNVIYALRVYKSKIEVDMIRSACHATVKAMNLCQAMTKMMPRITENELEAWIRVAFAQENTECCAFESIVAVDAHALDWHHKPTNRRVGNRILVDIGARKDFYCADMTRTWATGEASEQFVWMLSAVKQAHKVALEQCIPGKTQGDVEQAAQQVLTEVCNSRGIYGKPARCPHYITHWVGLDVHDVGMRQLPFVENVVLAVEPALYIGDIGVRWEDTVCITKNKCEILTSAAMSRKKSVRI